MMEIKLDDDADRWRFACPNGHRSWEPTNGHFWCAQCAKTFADDLDPEFSELRDRKTGELLERDEVRLLTPAGPYQDVHREGSA
jgi:protein-arginine kinase activator protein McsA